eukprot:TRINITY_DN1855_c0_g1_i1.p1 TRINITY_DN1855_c0_g1~~TRINITY_DN1855_c0_g1_i1.p1  ORF type:complete len:465 (-),score=91.01 TRINITY_DN1855_c0_g1_i1:777-2171(-)
MRTFVTVFFFFSLSSCVQFTTLGLNSSRTDLKCASAGKIVLFGPGQLLNYTSSGAVDVFDLSTGKIQSASPIQPRTSYGMTSTKRKIVIAGGENQQIKLDSIDVYDVITKKWTQDRLSIPRSQVVATSVGDYVFVAGGLRPNSYSETSDIVDVFNFESNIKLNLSLSQPRYYLTATSLGNMAMFAGGVSNASVWKTTTLVDIFTVKTDGTIERTQSSLSLARSEIGSTSTSKLAFFAGGATNDDAPTRVVDIYSLQYSNWTVARLTSARFYIAATSFNETAFFAGGLTSVTAVGSKLVDIYGQNQTWYSMSLFQVSGLLSATSLGGYIFFTAGDIVERWQWGDVIDISTASIASIPLTTTVNTPLVSPPSDKLPLILGIVIPLCICLITIAIILSILYLLRKKQKKLFKEENFHHEHIMSEQPLKLSGKPLIIKQEIGKGSTGRVFLAQWDDQIVAVKKTEHRK